MPPPCSELMEMVERLLRNYDRNVNEKSKHRLPRLSDSTTVRILWNNIICVTESYDYKICGKYRVKDNEAYSAVSCCYLKCSRQSFVKSVHILPPYNEIPKAGRWRWNVSAISPFPTRVFYKMRTSTTVNTHGRLVEIGIPRIWKPMKLPQLSKRTLGTKLVVFVNSKKRMVGKACAEVTGTDQG